MAGCRRYIEVEGIKYYNDRFYLQASTGIESSKASTCGNEHDHVVSPQTHPEQRHSDSHSHSHSHSYTPPPLFDRSKLISSLDLSAAIVGTYSFDPQWLHQELPSLFPPPPPLSLSSSSLSSSNVAPSYENFKKAKSNRTTSAVPTLLLHGLHHATILKMSQKLHSKLKSQVTENISPAQNSPSLFDSSVSLARIEPTWVPPSSSSPPPPSSVATEAAVTTTTSTNSPPPNTKNHTKRLRGVHHPKYFILFEKRGSIVIIISTLNLTKPTAVDASWIQRFDLNKDYKDNDMIQRNKTTINMEHNSQFLQTNDFGWTLMDFLQKSQDAISTTSTITSTTTETCVDMPNIPINDHPFLLPLDFIKQYVPDIKSWEDFANKYRFQDASVFLVSTVPGCYPGNTPLLSMTPQEEDRKSTINANNVERNGKKMSFLYGPQRVHQILHRLRQPLPIPTADSTDSNNHDSPTVIKENKLQLPIKRKRFGLRGIDRWKQQSNLHHKQQKPSNKEYRPFLPSDDFTTSDDRLIMQTTSLGGNWTYSSMEELVKIYLEPNDNLSQEKKTTSSPMKQEMCHSLDFLNRADLVWPSLEFIQSCHQPNMLKEKSCFAFLSSSTFNTISVDCLSRMALYEHSDPPQMLLPSMDLINGWNERKGFTPHLKSFGRLLSTKIPHEKQHISSSITECRSSQSTRISERQYFAWFMITSACLSKGAQGQPTPNRTLESDSKTYSNFELGVIFCSRLQGNSNTDRIYAWNTESGWEKQRIKINDILTNKTSLSSKIVPSTLEVIHLPIPFKIRPKMYMEDPDDTDMSYTPYFHYIEPGTEVVGQMRLTPLGREGALKLS